MEFRLSENCDWLMQWVFKEKQRIQISRWDELISSHESGLPYGFSWYLDALVKHWGGFILNDYQAVCPVPLKSSFFYKRKIFQPLFCQQLGVFERAAISKIDFKALLHQMTQFGIKNRYHFNFINANYLTGTKHIHFRQNSILSLDQSYQQIREKYAHGLVSSLKHASISNYQIEEELPIEQFVAMYKTQHAAGLKEVRVRHYKKLIALLKELKSKGYLKMILLRNKEGKVLCGAAFQMLPSRIIYFLGFSTILGRKDHTMSFLLDQIIRKNTEQKSVFDFEGSEIPGVQQFFSRFGITDQKYPVWNSSF